MPGGGEPASKRAKLDDEAGAEVDQVRRDLSQNRHVDLDMPPAEAETHSFDFDCMLESWWGSHQRGGPHTWAISRQHMQ
jgi:hypothetical protein